MLFATVCFYLFVWKHEIFKGFREVVIKQLKERGILRKNYVIKWWEELIINFIFMLIAIGFVWISLVEDVRLLDDFWI